MKKAELRAVLEVFWALDGQEQEEYFNTKIFPHLIDAMRTGQTKFIWQMVAVMKERDKRKAAK